MKRFALPVLLSLLVTACTSPVPAPDAPFKSAAQPTAARLSAQAVGRWVSGTYYSAYGARFYRLWVPGGYVAGSGRPMLVMLHGCQQDAYDFAAGTRMNALADARNFLVLYPEQGTAYNGADCWNWYYSANQYRGAGEPSVIAGMIAWAKSNYSVNASKVVVAGLSAGAAMANVMGCTYPDHIKGVVSVAGVMYQGATTGTGGVNAMSYGSIYDPNATGRACHTEMSTRKHPMPTLVFQGTADSIVNPVNATQTLSQWAQTNDLAYDSLDNGEVDDVADATITGTTCRAFTRSDYRNTASGGIVMQKYLISGMGHAWPGGSSSGTYTDPCAPDASTIIVNFFGF